MKSNKVFGLLRTFSKEEFLEFGKFIASPFFAKGRNVVPLYRYLRKYYPESDSPKMTNEEISLIIMFTWVMSCRTAGNLSQLKKILTKG